MPSSPGPRPSVVAASLREALETADCLMLADLLHPNVHWSPPEGGETGCHTRSHVLSRFSRLHALGLRATTEETFTYPTAAVLGLRIHGTVPPAAPENVGYHVFDVTGGLITRITGYADRAQALEAAFTGSAAARPAESGHWRGYRSGASG
ncbi:nuclear transport factor 2 family protein [Streptomyces sp. NPDC096012]|uniref:nuclear transport factor 2 family protein n=1 Tax=Streptomyces sp. NPDC096012 TaxID=3155684 RepID=UPI00336AD8BC